MGAVKHEMARLEALEGHARDIAVKARAIEECERHPGTFLSCDDIDANNRAYAMGTKKIKSGVLSCERQELMDAIKKAITDTSDVCHSCDRLERE